jgi:hypothetical protein
MTYVSCGGMPQALGGTFPSPDGRDEDLDGANRTHSGPGGVSRC